VRVIDFVFGSSGEGWSEEVRALLEKRLKFLALLADAVMAAHLVHVFAITDLNSNLPRVEAAVAPSVAAWMAAMTVLLFTRRAPSLRLLRGVETSVLLALSFSLFVSSYGWLAHGQAVGGTVSPALEEAARDRLWVVAGGDTPILSMGAFKVALEARIVASWALLAVGYAVIVPNTWRRAAAILSLMVVLPVAAETLAATQNPVVRPMLGSILFLTSYGMAAFASMSLYGCHKLDSLRREAFDARQVGQYKLVREIGRGGMGAVYLAEHRHLRRPCAVKLIREGRATALHVARFEREVQSMARLTHPNTVEIYDYGRTDEGTFFYAMELLPGMTLEELVVKHGPLPPGRVIHLLRQACGALAEAHALGLIHRDVTPANLFVCERGGLHDFLKILDFGLVQDRALTELPAAIDERTGDGDALSASMSSSLAHLTRRGAILGTPAYVSPEQIRGEEADARSDVYALGGVAFYLLVGAPAFRGNVLELCVAHLASDPPRPSERNARVPVDLDAIALRCLAKDPAARFQTARELEVALAGCGVAPTWGSEQAAAWWAEQGASRLTPAPTGQEQEPHAATGAVGSRA
jgi:tRNA A-37 threonylcarbamoyl transferase component Bud32